VQTGVAAVEKGRVRGDGEENRQHLPEAIGDRDGAIGAPDPDVDVEAPGVVALRDPAELALEELVVRRVDDLLIEVVRPGMGSGRRERDPHRLGQLEQARAPVELALLGLGEALASPGADLDLRRDQLAGRGERELGVVAARRLQLLEAVLQLEGLGVDERELLLDPHGEVGRALEGLANPLEVEP
jgi:hypothetical protein